MNAPLHNPEVCTCGIQPGPAYAPDPRVSWRHASFCKHSLLDYHHKRSTEQWDHGRKA
jgi:hypothetical protein